jgi:hypothetical protein
MGINTKAFVTATPTKILELMPKLITDINKWQRDLLDKVVVESKYDNRIQYLSNEGKDLWSNGISSITTSYFHSFSIYFKVYGESRRLFVTHTCSGDYEDTYKGDKIIFDLGCWGRSEEIMKMVGKSVSQFGRVFYVYNDCEDYFEELKFDVVN